MQSFIHHLTELFHLTWETRYNIPFFLLFLLGEVAIIVACLTGIFFILLKVICFIRFIYELLTGKMKFKAWPRKMAHSSSGSSGSSSSWRSSSSSSSNRSNFSSGGGRFGGGGAGGSW